MRIATALILALLAQEDKGESFYKFKKGTTWTYDGTEGEGKSKVVFVVTGEDGGKVKLEMKEYKESEKEPEAMEWTTFVEGGLLMWGTLKEGGDLPPIPIYKVGSKKGDTWSTTMGGEERKIEVKGSHEGTEEVKVPAGTYKDAVKTKVALGEEITLEFWLVPKVGIVKVKAGDQFGLELKEFKEGK